MLDSIETNEGATEKQEQNGQISPELVKAFELLSLSIYVHSVTTNTPVKVLCRSIGKDFYEFIKKHKKELGAYYDSIRANL